MLNFSDQINPLFGAEMTLKQLVEHYSENELPRLAYSTAAAYQSYMHSWIVPVWGNLKL